MWKIKDIRANYNETYVEAVFVNENGATENVLMNETECNSEFVLAAIERLDAQSRRVHANAERLKSEMLCEDNKDHS